MKEKPTKNGLVSDPNIDTDEWPPSPAPRNLEGKDRPKWYEMLPYDQFAQYLPQLRYVRGSKAKFSITTFQEISDVAQEIFEKNKSFFRFRVQVDLLAHYIGVKMLEHIYISRCGHKKSRLSELLESNEQQFAIWDQMKTVKEIFASILEKRIQGFVSEEEFEATVERYIDTFDEKSDRIKMAQIIDFLIDDGAVRKAKERVRKNHENKQRAKEAGIRGVK
jgi:hypothetical protein